MLPRAFSSFHRVPEIGKRSYPWIGPASKARGGRVTSAWKGTHLLRTTFVYFAFCILICGASHAQTAAPSTGQPDIEPRRVFVFDSIASFVPPEGFKPPSDA